MKKLAIILVLSSITSIGYAQQLQTSSLYDLKQVVINPALAGVSQQKDVKGYIGVDYRSQWTGISGSPKTVSVFGSTELQKAQIGIGGNIYKDETGPTSRTGISLDLAKHINFNNGSMFSIGIEARGLQYGIDRSKLTGSLGSDPTLGTSDNRFKFDAGFGMAYSSSTFQIGAAVSQLIQSKLDFYSGNLARSEEARLYRHYFFHANYRWNVDGVNTIVPHAVVTYLPNAPTDYQGGVRLEHNDLLFVGLGYRHKQSVMFNAGFNIQKKFTLAYNYDVYNNPVSLFDGGGGAHEVMLKYTFKK